MMIIRRRFVALAGVAALCAFAATRALAQGAPRSYAVVSEFARVINITVSQQTTGSHLDTNVNKYAPVAEGALDKVALITAKKAIEKADPGAKVWLLSPADADFFDARAVYTAGTIVKIPDDLAAALKGRGSSHLIIFMRLRSPANLRTINGSIGNGLLEGPGFYIDQLTSVKNVETLVNSVGFVAPYLYMRATLIDVPTGKVLETRRITEGEVEGASRADQTGNIWNSMSPSEKVGQIRELIEREIGKAVPPLLAAH